MLVAADHTVLPPTPNLMWRREGGRTVRMFAGDGVMAAFGIPPAHEDAAGGAGRAGRGILDLVSALGLQARVGIGAGGVVVDDPVPPFPPGGAVNLAARLQQAAAPGE